MLGTLGGAAAAGFGTAGLIAAAPAAGLGLGAVGAVTLLGWKLAAGGASLGALIGNRLASSGAASSNGDLADIIVTVRAEAAAREDRLRDLEQEYEDLLRKQDENQARSDDMLRFIKILVAAARIDGAINSAEEAEIVRQSYSNSIFTVEEEVRRNIKIAIKLGISASEAWALRMQIAEVRLISVLRPAIVAVIEVDAHGDRHPEEDRFIASWDTFEGRPQAASNEERAL